MTCPNYNALKQDLYSQRTASHTLNFSTRFNAIMTLSSILTKKRKTRPPRSWPKLNTRLTAFPRHTYYSSYCRAYEPLGAVSERCPLTLIHRTTTFSDGSKDPDTIVQLNLYPTLTNFRCSQDIIIGFYGSSNVLRKSFFLPADMQEDVPCPARHAFRARRFPNVLAINIEALEHERNLIKLQEQRVRDSWFQQWGESWEDSAIRYEKAMAEAERKKREEEEEERRWRMEVGADTDNEVEDDEEEEEDEEHLAMSDKKKRGGKKNQRARVEVKLRKAKEERVEAKFEDRKRRPLRPSPPPDSGSDADDDEDYGGRRWADDSDEQAQPARDLNAPVVQVESATKEDPEEAEQRPVIKLPPSAPFNTGERASLSGGSHVQEESAPRPVVRLPPSAAYREENFETLPSPVDQPSFAASKEEYLEGTGQGFLTVKIPPYSAPTPSSTKNKEEEWDKVLSRKEKRKAKKARRPSPSRPENQDPQVRAPRPRFPGTRRRSQVQNFAGSAEQLEIGKIQKMMGLQRQLLDQELRKMKDEYEAKYPAEHYDAATHTSRGNRRASDPGLLPNPSLNQTPTPDLKPAPLGMKSGLKTYKKKKKRWWYFKNSAESGRSTTDQQRKTPNSPGKNRKTPASSEQKRETSTSPEQKRKTPNSPDQKLKTPTSPDQKRKTPTSPEQTLKPPSNLDRQPETPAPTRPSKVPINREPNPPPPSKTNPPTAQRTMIFHHHHRVIHHHHHHHQPRRPSPLQIAPKSTLSPTALPYSPASSQPSMHEEPPQQQYQYVSPAYVAPPMQQEQQL
ncbi:hypothetical protein BKA81DRAFT_17095 [Phyllosticta paracitricarpa]|uniref:Uncharacterized protein n=1 Tax=Phyllosticta paracitricarpa TaxID=2016321 RepID=A0ABR1N5G2_9PEZI